MITSFISSTVQYLLEKETHTNYTIILPSKRAVTFFKKEYALQVQATQFLPEIISIDHFIEQVSGLKHTTPSELQFFLYNIYKKSSYYQEKDSFEDFLKWGTTIIQDFNEVDRYLIDEKSFFYYHKNIQELKNWGTNDSHWSLDKNKTKLTENATKSRTALQLIY